MDIFIHPDFYPYYKDCPIRLVDIGASGGISGLIVYYALKFPKIRLGILLFFVHWVRAPAVAFIFFWIIFQFVTATEQVLGVTNISALGHLGGAAVGILFWLFWRNKQ